MNVLWVLIVAVPIFLLAYRFFGRYLERTMSGGEEQTAPAVSLNDGTDYVPSKTPIVFSHHFASIAGAGPIVGPTVAMIYGYIPVWLWVLCGAVFIGAVQDYASLFVSMRERGHSMAQVADRTLGRKGFFLVMAFSIIILLLLTSAFLGLSATALTSLVPLDQMHMSAEKTFLDVVQNSDGVACAKIGGIASMSLIIITACAPVIGWLVHKRGVRLSLMVPAAIFLCFLSIVFGVTHPLTLSPLTWMIALTVYVALASGLPVWAILQPRDFINSFLLYFGMALLIVGVLAAGIRHDTFQMPAFNLAGGQKALGLVWPFLFITVACGAISGFHAMVTGGTTSKQLTSERASRGVGYGGMLMEGFLALLVVVAIGAGLTLDEFSSLVFPTATGVGSNPVLAFALGMGNLVYRALGIPMEYGTVFGMLMVEGFIVTTLDTAARLNRYLLEELWTALFKKTPRLLASHFFNACIVASLMFLFCYTNTFKYIWPIFGSANQLMAAMTLVVVAVWLALRSRPVWFAVWPAAFMMVTTLVSLVDLLIHKYIPARNIPLILTDVLLIVLAFGVMILAIGQFLRLRVARAKSSTPRGVA